MAGGNNKPSSSSSSSHKSRWESGPTKPPSNRNLPVSGNPRNLPPPPPLKPKPSSNNNPVAKPSPQHPSPSGGPFPYPDNHGPPPSYGFHMLERRSIGLADGSARSYFALPLNYQDFVTPLAPPRFLGNEGKQFPMSPDFRESRNKNQEYWNSLGKEGTLKRKFLDEGDERDGLARQRQQLLQYGNAGLNSGGGTSNVYGREEDLRGGKFMRGEEGGRSGGRGKFSEVDQVAVKKAFLHFVKVVNEDSGLRKSCLADGKQGRVNCVACRRVIPESVIYSYGTVLLDLLSGKHIPPSHALDLIRGKNVLLLVDSSLEGQYANEDATALVTLASQCLNYEARDRPEIKFLLTAVAPLQKQKEVASHVLMGLTKTPAVLPTMLSPLGKACARMDLTAVHDILLKTGYRDEEGADNELSFQEWTQQVQDMLNTKKFGDIAFRDKDFTNAVDYYSKLVSMMSVPSGTIFVRRAISYLMLGQPEFALRDAMQAQVCLPEWPTAFYMQALALSKLGMETDAQDMLNDGAAFEAKKQNSWRN